MDIPEKYHGREQSYLKHRILKKYLNQWSTKLGSLSRKGPIKLWYVDCFAGPWRSQDQQLEDTSIAIGLHALEEAANTWRAAAHTKIELGAIFIEKDAVAYGHLKEYLDNRSGVVDVHHWHGEFGQYVPRIPETIKDDPAFVFVDPTGFKGVEMRFIAPLMEERMRDVLVNVMFNDINRFKDDPRTFLREQMRDFFGLKDLEEDSMPKRLTEEDLLALYRKNLKSLCQIQYAADLAVPHPTRERTWFRLVIGGNHQKVLEVFRDVESKVIGREAATVRTAAKHRDVVERSGQLSFGDAMSPPRDRWYESQNAADREKALAALTDRLRGHGQQKFGDLWPALLEDHHVTRRELARLVVAKIKEGVFTIKPERKPVSNVKDDEWIALAR